MPRHLLSAGLPFRTPGSGLPSLPRRPHVPCPSHRVRLPLGGPSQVAPFLRRPFLRQTGLTSSSAFPSLYYDLYIRTRVTPSGVSYVSGSVDPVLVPLGERLYEGPLLLRRPDRELRRLHGDEQVSVLTDRHELEEERGPCQTFCSPVTTRFVGPGKLGAIESGCSSFGEGLTVTRVSTRVDCDLRRVSERVPSLFR